MITIYSKPNCPHCVGAETWLTENEFPYAKVDVSQNAEALAKIKRDGHRTVPQIYRDDTLLVEGGYSGLRQLGAEALRKKVRPAR